MGFSKESAVDALANNDYDLQLAANWLATTSKQNKESTFLPQQSSTITAPVLVPTPGVRDHQTPSPLTKPVVPGFHHEPQGLPQGLAGGLPRNRMIFSSPSNTAGMGGGGSGEGSGLEIFLSLKQQPSQIPVTKNNPTVVSEHSHRASRLKESREKYASLFGDDG